MPPALPPVQGPPCRRCAQALRILVEGDLITARCPACRYARVFAPQTSPWAAMAEVAKAGS